MDTLNLCNQIAKKSSLLNSIVNNTKEAFLIFSKTAEEIIKEMLIALHQMQIAVMRIWLLIQ